MGGWEWALGREGEGGGHLAELEIDVCSALLYELTH
jgi:hypothetical protein